MAYPKWVWSPAGGWCAPHTSPYRSPPRDLVHRVAPELQAASPTAQPAAWRGRDGRATRFPRHAIPTGTVPSPPRHAIPTPDASAARPQVLQPAELAAQHGDRRGRLDGCLVLHLQPVGLAREAAVPAVPTNPVAVLVQARQGGRPELQLSCVWVDAFDPAFLSQAACGGVASCATPTCPAPRVRDCD